MLARRYIAPVFGFAALVALTALSNPLAAQVGSAAITGTVTDRSGAVIAAVKVTIVETSTNFESVSETNGSGVYRAQSLLPGTYDVSFQAPGFKRFTQKGLLLRVGDVLPVEAVLDVGSVTEQVEVTAHGAVLETETSSTNTVTEGDFLYKMPLYQRYVLNTLNFSPGVTMNGYAYGGSLGGFNVAGQRSTGTTVFEDGVFGNDPQSSTGTDIKPVENAVGEVQVVTGTLPAEYGHTTGGVVTVAKKSGTNELHGTASDLGRTRSMTHRQFFNIYKTSDPQPGAPEGVPAWFMQLDASISGPVVIPKLYNGKNKTFFFFGYQKLIEKKSAAFTSQTPTPALLGRRLHVRRSRTATLRSIHNAATRQWRLDARSDSREHHPGQQNGPGLPQALLAESMDRTEYAGHAHVYWSSE